MPCPECGTPIAAESRFCSSCGARVEPKREATGDPLREALEKAIGFQYRIERLLGRGGMGAVYLAHELALDRDVAIKVLPPELAGTAERRSRFRREARTAARLNHPNIVPLYTFGEVNGLIYFVMGYVEGESLASRLRRDGPMEPEQARTIVAEIADALAYAHRHEVVHRDIKPDNILIDTESGAPRLTDFGISKAGSMDTQLTTAGQVMGTPSYMSPEQAQGRPDIDARSDIYSLGVVAYEMVSACLPFEADNPMQALTQRLTHPPRPLRAVAPDVPDDLATVIDRCLQREAANRWPDAKSLRLELAPTDDEADDPLVLRNLRVATFVIAILTPTTISTAIFGWFNDGRIRVLAVMLTSALVSFLIMTVVSTVVLLRQGFSMRTIIHGALRQPRGWRFWYPRRFRRKGDMWDRLPESIRRSRLHFGLACVFIFGIYLPLFIGISAAFGAHAIQNLQYIPLLLLAVLFGERRKATKAIAAKLGTSRMEASRIMSTPSWRTSVWQRGPAATLIRQNTKTTVTRAAALPSDRLSTRDAQEDNRQAETRL
jgi:serine/threonine protein kinase